MFWCFWSLENFKYVSHLLTCFLSPFIPSLFLLCLLLLAAYPSSDCVPVLQHCYNCLTGSTNMEKLVGEKSKELLFIFVYYYYYYYFNFLICFFDKYVTWTYHIRKVRNLYKCGFNISTHLCSHFVWVLRFNLRSCTK